MRKSLCSCFILYAFALFITPILNSQNISYELCPGMEMILMEKTANGEIYDPGQYTASHRIFRFGTEIEVENLENGNKVRSQDK